VLGQVTPEGGRRRLSVTRVVIALVLLGAVGAGVTALAKRQMDRPQPVANDPILATWFAPYVDLTATPTYQFQDPGYDPARQVVLGFVVASDSGACTPTWGGTYSLDAAAVSLDLDRRVIQYRERGDAVAVSFGGSAGSELALACPEPAELADAYVEVIKRYGVSLVDFDLEGAALSDSAAVQRRAIAVASLQKQLAASDTPLTVWLTLPVGPAGLTGLGRAAVATMLAAHVQLAGVNVLAMDFGKVGEPDGNLLATTETALGDAEGQLSDLYARAGLHFDSTQAWNRLGVTVMIGQNDVPGEQFTVSQAAKLAAFAGLEHMARVSIWSLNRDSACGSYYDELGVLSDDCSGVTQTTLGFDDALIGLKGSLPMPPATFPPPVGDDPATAPYPIWEPQQTYAAGYKVVWQGDVYQAKWSSTASPPDTPVQYAYQTPWLLVGPVLPTDRAPAIPTLKPGTYPAWSPKVGYSEGARVLLSGLPYEAKWYSQGDQPGADPADPAASPWEPLFTVPGEPTSSP
jgi:chitinase